MIYRVLSVLTIMSLLSAFVLTDRVKAQSSDLQKNLDVRLDFHLIQSNNWETSLKKVGKDDIIRVRVRVKNTSTATIKDLEVVNVLPASLSMLEGSEREKIEELPASEQRTIVYTTKFNSDDFVLDKDLCLQVTANVLKGKDVVVTKSGDICYLSDHNSFQQVLGAQVTQSPETAAGGYDLLGYGAFIMAGANLLFGIVTLMKKSVV